MSDTHTLEDLLEQLRKFTVDRILNHGEDILRTGTILVMKTIGDYMNTVFDGPNSMYWGIAGSILSKSFITKLKNKVTPQKNRRVHEVRLWEQKEEFGNDGDITKSDTILQEWNVLTWMNTRLLQYHKNVEEAQEIGDEGAIAYWINQLNGLVPKIDALYARADYKKKIPKGVIKFSGAEVLASEAAEDGRYRVYDYFANVGGTEESTTFYILGCNEDMVMHETVRQLQDDAGLYVDKDKRTARWYQYLCSLLPILTEEHLDFIIQTANASDSVRAKHSTPTRDSEPEKDTNEQRMEDAIKDICGTNINDEEINNMLNMLNRIREEYGMDVYRRAQNNVNKIKAVAKDPDLSEKNKIIKMVVLLEENVVLLHCPTISQDTIMNTIDSTELMRLKYTPPTETLINALKNITSNSDIDVDTATLQICTMFGKLLHELNKNSL